jgi:Uma2 family endonuclease
MASGEPDLLVRYPWVTWRPITVAEYHRMGEAGILTEDDRVELIEGQPIAMSPIGSHHSGTINTLNRSLVLAVGDRNVKRALYARHGIPEFWIVNLTGQQVEICCKPETGEYTTISQVGRDGIAEPDLLPGMRIPVAILMR